MVGSIGASRGRPACETSVSSSKRRGKAHKLAKDCKLSCGAVELSVRSPNESAFGSRKVVWRDAALHGEGTDVIGGEYASRIIK